MLASTMMDDFPLSLQMLFRHGRKVHFASNVITWTGHSRAHISQPTHCSSSMIGPVSSLHSRAGHPRS